MINLKDLSTRDLFKEILTRLGKDDCVEIQIGKIMKIGYYPTHVKGARFFVSAESHSTLETTDIEKAVERILYLYEC